MDTIALKKIYRSIILAWVIAVTWAMALNKPWIGLSLTTGVMVGAGIFASYERAIRKYFVPQKKNLTSTIFKLVLIKYPIICTLIYGLLKWEQVSIPAFCGGIVIVHFAVMVKVLAINKHSRLAANKHME